MGAEVTDDGQILISTAIEEISNKGTFYTLFLEGPDCQRIFPSEYYIYSMWGNWSLDVWWTKDTFVNGNLVKHEEGAWRETGELMRQQNIMPQVVVDSGPIWMRLGFAAPTEGVRSLGAKFPLTPAQIQQSGDMVGVLHLTQEKKGEYSTVGLPFRFLFQEENKKDKTNLIMLIRPTVVRSNDEMD